MDPQKSQNNDITGVTAGKDKIDDGTRSLLENTDDNDVDATGSLPKKISVGEASGDDSKGDSKNASIKIAE